MTDLDDRGGITIRRRALSDDRDRSDLVGYENHRRLLLSPALKVVGITMAPFGQLDLSASKTFHPKLSESRVPHSAFPARLWKSIRGTFGQAHSPEVLLK
jgi:hypothetical protein